MNEPTNVEKLRDAEQDPARNRRIPVDLLDELSNEILQAMAERQPTVPVFEPPDLSEEELQQVRSAVFAIMAIEEYPSAEFMREHGDVMAAYQNRLDALRLADAQQAPDSAAVWRFGDDERWATLIQEGYEAGQAPTKTTVLVTRPLSPTERVFEEATHVRVTLDFAHKQGEPGALGGVQVHRDFGVIERGTFTAYDLEDEDPTEWKDKRLDDCQPTGANIVLDEKFATEAEVRTARNMLYQLSREGISS